MSRYFLTAAITAMLLGCGAFDDTSSDQSALGQKAQTKKEGGGTCETPGECGDQNQNQNQNQYQNQYQYRCGCEEGFEQCGCQNQHQNQFQEQEQNTEENSAQNKNEGEPQAQQQMQSQEENAEQNQNQLQYQQQGCCCCPVEGGEPVPGEVLPPDEGDGAGEEGGDEEVPADTDSPVIN